MGLGLAVAALAVFADRGEAKRDPSAAAPSATRPKVAPSPSPDARPSSNPRELVRQLERALGLDAATVAPLVPRLAAEVRRDPTFRAALAEVVAKRGEDVYARLLGATLDLSREQLAVADLARVVDEGLPGPPASEALARRERPLVARLGTVVRDDLRVAGSGAGSAPVAAAGAAYRALWRLCDLTRTPDPAVVRAFFESFAAMVFQRKTTVAQAIVLHGLVLHLGYFNSDFLVQFDASDVGVRAAEFLAEHPDDTVALLTAGLVGLEGARHTSGKRTRDDEARASQEALLRGAKGWLATFRERTSAPGLAADPETRRLRAIERFEWCRALELNVIDLEAGPTQADLRTSERLEKAAAVAREALDLGHPRPDKVWLELAIIHLTRGAILIRMGQPAHAEFELGAECGKTAVQEQDRLAKVQDELAERKDSDPVAALAVLALDLIPQNATGVAKPYFILSDIYEAETQTRDARAARADSVAALYSGLALDPEDRHRRGDLAERLANLGRSEAALVEIDRSLVIDRMDGDAWAEYPGDRARLEALRARLVEALKH